MVLGASDFLATDTRQKKFAAGMELNLGAL
jgi:hypothetical protein